MSRSMLYPSCLVKYIITQIRTLSRQGASPLPVMPAALRSATIRPWMRIGSSPINATWTGHSTASFDGHPEQGFRSCLGILRLGKTYDSDRPESRFAVISYLLAPDYPKYTRPSSIRVAKLPPQLRSTLAR